MNKREKGVYLSDEVRHGKTVDYGLRLVTGYVLTRKNCHMNLNFYLFYCSGYL